MLSFMVMGNKNFIILLWNYKGVGEGHWTKSFTEEVTRYFLEPRKKKFRKRRHFSISNNIFTSEIGPFRVPLRACNSSGFNWNLEINASATVSFICILWLIREEMEKKCFYLEQGLKEKLEFWLVPWPSSTKILLTLGNYSFTFFLFTNSWQITCLITFPSG